MELVRTDPGADRRVKELVLTGAGQRCFAEGYGLWREAQDRLRDLVGPEVFDRMVGDLATVTERIGAADGHEETST